MINDKTHAKILKSLRDHVKVLRREFKFLETQIERHTRHAPPVGKAAKHVNKLEREQIAVEKKMDQILRAVASLREENYGKSYT